MKHVNTFDLEACGRQAGGDDQNAKPHLVLHD